MALMLLSLIDKETNERMLNKNVLLYYIEFLDSSMYESNWGGEHHVLLLINKQIHTWTILFSLKFQT